MITSKTKIGKYHIVESIAQGGMARIYKAYQPNLDRYVAIKVMALELAQDVVFREQFEQEAKILAKLEHPNILPIYDYGYHDNMPYLVMQYVSEGTLTQRMGKRLPPDEAVSIISQVGDALGYAHAKGIVHQDVKPSNILFTKSGQLLLADFGIAKVMATRGIQGGTRAYMAPEQKTDHPIDGRADIFSMGILLYEMLSGKRKAEMTHLSDIVASSKLPQAFLYVVHCATDSIPNNRHATAEAFVIDAQEALLKTKDHYSGPPTTIQQTVEIMIVAAIYLGGLWFGFQAIMGLGEQYQANTLTLFNRNWLPTTIAALYCFSSATILTFRDRTIAHSARSILAMMMLLFSGLLFYICVRFFPQPNDFLDAWVFTMVGIVTASLATLLALYLYITDRRSQQTAPLALLKKQQSSLAHRSHLRIRAVRYTAMIYATFFLLVVSGLHVVGYLMAESVVGQLSKMAEYFMLWLGGIMAVLLSVWLLIWYLFSQVTLSLEDDNLSLFPKNLSIVSNRQKQLKRAYQYQEQIQQAITQTSAGPLQSYLQQITQQVNTWVAYIEHLTTRLNQLEQDPLLQRDRSTVPRAVQNLEIRLAQAEDTDTNVKQAAQQTLAARQQQLQHLRSLERVISQAELQCEETIAALGSVYAQILLIKTQDKKQAQRIQTDIETHLLRLQDLLEAIEEIRGDSSDRAV